MDPARQREIASKGGRAAHAKGTAHQFTPDEAREAGRKGGQTVSRNRAHMAAIGREGGHSRGRNRERDDVEMISEGREIRNEERHSDSMGRSDDSDRRMESFDRR